MDQVSGVAGAYRDERRPAARLEYVLAVGRVFLAVTGFLAIYFDPSEPDRLAAVTYTVLVLYAVYSALVLAFIRRAPLVRPVHGRVLHAIDVLFVSALIFVSDGPVSPFFLFYLYLVLAASYRWGFRETAGTAFLTMGVFLMETAVAVLGPWRAVLLGADDFELNRTIIRVGYLAITGCLMGYLAEHEKRYRTEMSTIAEAMQQPRVELALGGSVEALGQMLLRLFNAPSLAIVIQEHDAGAISVWSLERADNRVSARRTELDAGDQEPWFFTTPARTWHVASVPDNRTCRGRAVQPGAWRLRPVSVEVPPDFPLYTRHSLAMTDIGLDREWRGRVILYGMNTRGSVERQIHFLDTLMTQVTPALTNMVLLRRLRSQASAAERARVARELHDSTIQALIGLEMKIAALHRAAEMRDSHIAEELASIQELLRAEILGVRELMQALRPVELDAVHELPDVLASVVERFRRDSGVQARFVSNIVALDITPSMSIEIVRIVQEALANVRKHSRARNVLVRLTQEGERYTLTVEDDGRGFEFEGLYSQEQLDRARIGPAIIKERARLIGGRVSLESSRDVGARIEITFGVHAHA